jgi:hypothetical protein
MQFIITLKYKASFHRLHMFNKKKQVTRYCFHSIAHLSLNISKNKIIRIPLNFIHIDHELICTFKLQKYIVKKQKKRKRENM